jgi:hypothetical protein
MKRTLLCILAAALVFALIGCGADTAVPDQQGNQENQAEQPQDQGPYAAADVIEPDQIVTLGEAMEIMGVDLAEGDKTDNEIVGQKLCTYESPDPDSFSFFEVTVTQTAFLPQEQIDNGISPEGIYMMTKDNFVDTLEPVTGIGDDAFIDTPGLHLWYRGYYVVIGLGNSDDPANIERLKQAGQIAVNNLDAILG